MINKIQKIALISLLTISHAVQAKLVTPEFEASSDKKNLRLLKTGASFVSD